MLPKNRARYLNALPIFIIVIAAFLRLWQIGVIPPGFHLDESFEGYEAWRILTDATYRPLYLRGNFGVPPLNAYANAITFGIFNQLGQPPGPTAMRITAALLGILSVAALFPLAHEIRKFDGNNTKLSLAFPLFAAATLAVMRWHIHFSRMGIEPIFVPLVWVICSWLLLRGWRSNAWGSFVGSGVVFGLGMYTYRGAWVIPFIMLAVSAYLLAHSVWTGTFARKRVVQLLLCGGVALIVFAPLALLFTRNPELIFLRLNQLSIVGQTGSPADNSVQQSFWAMTKMFGPFGAVGDADPRRNLPGAPALNIWLVIPFYFGLLLALVRINRPVYVVSLLGLIGLLSPGVISEYAPHFHRVLGGAAPTAIFCAIGLDQLWQWRPGRAQFVHWIAVALVVIGAFVGVRNYFVHWANLPDLFYAFDVGLWDLGQWAADQPADSTYISPRTLEHPTLAFALRETDPHARPITFDGRYIFPLAQKPVSPETYVSIEHEDFRTPLLLPGVFPDAAVEREMLDANDEIYARFYVRPPSATNRRPPQIERAVELGDGINLVGYDVQPETLNAGGILYLQLHWETDAAPTADWTTFSHLLRVAEDGAETQVAGKDGPPGNGSLITTRWVADWRILDEYQLALPADLAVGEYLLRIGMYQASGERLPADERGIDLGVVVIE